MSYCNNHFPDTLEFANAIVADGVTGLFGEDYIAGQYVYIHNTKVNDGVYKVVSATSSKITLDATLTPEATDRTMYIFGCAIPTDFLAVVAEIEAWESSNGGKDGIASETVSRYSVSFSDSGGWTKAFAPKLKVYRCIYDPIYKHVEKLQRCCYSGR